MMAKVTRSRGGCESAAAARNRRRCGFTLVELLVVVSVLAILISIVWKGSSVLIKQSKVRDTEALLKQLDQALTQFESDKPFARVPLYAERYNDAPADELGVLSGNNAHWPLGIPGTPGIHVVPDGSSGNNAVLNVPAKEESRYLLDDPWPSQRSVEAFILCVRRGSPSAAVMLDGVSERFRARETQWSYQAPGDSQPRPLEYYVDSWGTPLEYFATVRVRPGEESKRELLSMHVMKASNNRAVFASYGPNGQEQFDPEMRATGLDKSMLGDFSLNGDNSVNDLLNKDNLFSIEGVGARLQ
jgi:prepilin-type N-terminal cleavage/methylation domain-containing protein